MFSESQRQALNMLWIQIHQDFTYTPKETLVGKLKACWEPDSALQPAQVQGVKFAGICESFSRVALMRCTQAGYKARLVVCYDELGEGHCICEVADTAEEEAWYFDNRQSHLVAQEELKGYRFLGVSPWNPVPGETRPWQLVG